MSIPKSPGSSRRRGMVHLNNNLMCAVDTETTGDIPGFHDIYQVAIIPLDGELKPYKDIMPFYFDMQLRRPDNIDPEVYKKHRAAICNAQTQGLDPDRVADMLDEWFQRLALPFNKNLIPLAQNWPFDRGFLMEWLGKKSFEYIFNPLFRDTMSISTFLNDRADFHNEPCPYAKNNLNWLTKTLGVELDRAHDAMQDAAATAKVYREFCKRH